VAKVTITTLLHIHKFKAFPKLMIEGQERRKREKKTIRLLSIEGQPTNKVLAQTSRPMG
jgi:hypothetical protein